MPQGYLSSQVSLCISFRLGECSVNGLSLVLLLSSFLPHRPRLHALWQIILKLKKESSSKRLLKSPFRGLSHRPISIYKGIQVPHTCFTGRLDSNSHQLISTLGVSELHNITYVAIVYRFHLPIRIRS